MAGAFGFDKYQKKLYDLGIRRFVDEMLPYKVVRDAWKGTLNEDNKQISQYNVTPGKQLKILFLRVWSEYTGTSVIKIIQGSLGTEVGSAPAGVIDYPMLEAAGAEVIGPVPLDHPVHVLEGSVSFEVQDPSSAAAGGNQISLVWWGVEEVSPRPRTIRS